MNRAMCCEVLHLGKVTRCYCSCPAPGRPASCKLEDGVGIRANCCGRMYGFGVARNDTNWGDLCLKTGAIPSKSGVSGRGVVHFMETK